MPVLAARATGSFFFFADFFATAFFAAGFFTTAFFSFRRGFVFFSVGLFVAMFMVGFELSRTG
jgi:hypothetical protein